MGASTEGVVTGIQRAFVTIITIRRGTLVTDTIAAGLNTGTILRSQTADNVGIISGIGADVAAASRLLTGDVGTVTSNRARMTLGVI